jgi:hypothetical protein
MEIHHGRVRSAGRYGGMRFHSRRWFAALLAALAIVSSLTGCRKAESEPETQGEQHTTIASNGVRIGYASEGITAVDDPKALEKAVEAMYEAAQTPGIGLEYENDAYSEDGINFDCYIANSGMNQYDMFIAIYGDANYQDELFLSQLIRPGQAFNNITLNHALPLGDNTVYCAFTQIEEVDGEQSMHDQVIVTLNFHVHK